MKKWLSPRTLKLLMILLIIYVIVGIIFYAVQDKIIFHPKKLAPDHQYGFSQPYQEVNIPTGSHNLHFVKFAADSARKGIVLYFHGNMDNLERYAPAAPYFTRNGYDIWMIDYPGFGKTTGAMSEKRLYDDAMKMYELAAKESGRILIYGRSVGSGIAAQLASIRPCEHLLLETPYYSMTELGKSYAPLYPVRLLLKYQLPVHGYLEKVRAPVTIFHGREDELIPYSHAERLAASRPGITLVTINNGKHNDLLRHREFVAKLDSILR